MKVFVGPWNGDAYSIGLGQYDCADPPWTKPNAQRHGQDFSAVNDLLYLVADYCDDWAPWHATAPKVKTMFYTDPHRICTPGHRQLLRATEHRQPRPAHRPPPGRKPAARHLVQRRLRRHVRVVRLGLERRPELGRRQGHRRPGRRRPVRLLVVADEHPRAAHHHQRSGHAPGALRPVHLLRQPGTSTDRLDQRGYVYASLMLAYDPTYTVAGFQSTNYQKGSFLQLQPEMGLVPSQPRQPLAWPTRIASLQSAGGAYVREYTACSYFGRPVGNCAFVVNPSFDTSAPLPALAGHYASAVGFSGDGIFNGQWGQPDFGDDKDDIHFDGAIPASVPAAGWAILVETPPEDAP